MRSSRGGDARIVGFAATDTLNAETIHEVVENACSCASGPAAITKTATTARRDIAAIELATLVVVGATGVAVAKIAVAATAVAAVHLAITAVLLVNQKACLGKPSARRTRLAALRTGILGTDLFP